MIDMRHDALGVPLLDRGENGFVGAGDLVRIVVEAADQAYDHAQFGGEIVEQPQQAPVAADLADQAVEAVVLLELPRLIIEIGGPIENVELSP
jgi:hypothetical protein